MQQITNPIDLVPGRAYWLRNKKTGKAIASTLEATFIPGPSPEPYFLAPYLGDRIWAGPENAQAFKRWEIWGPIPEPDWAF